MFFLRNLAGHSCFSVVRVSNIGGKVVHSLVPGAKERRKGAPGVYCGACILISKNSW